MKKVLFALTILVLASLACNLGAKPVPTLVFPTDTATSVPTFGPTATPVILTPTYTATITQTPTPGAPMFTANTDLNCRSGPGTEYSVISGVYKNQSVLILGVTTPDRPLWWFVTNSGIRCWVSGAYGSVSGRMDGVIVLTPPPTPTVTPVVVNAVFTNISGGPICRLDFYVGATVTHSEAWNKGDFKNGQSHGVIIGVGHYDIIQAYNCGLFPDLVASLVNVVIKQNGDSFYLPIPTPTPTSTITQTPTATPTFTQTLTQTPSITPFPSSTPTQTATSTETLTATP